MFGFGLSRFWWGFAFGVGVFCLGCGLELCFLIVVLGFGVGFGSFEGGRLIV